MKILPQRSTCINCDYYRLSSCKCEAEDGVAESALLSASSLLRFYLLHLPMQMWETCELAIHPH